MLRYPNVLLRCAHFTGYKNNRQHKHPREKVHQQQVPQEGIPERLPSPYRPASAATRERVSTETLALQDFQLHPLRLTYGHPVE